ncbi:MAG: amino acid adenylation domain-containing protein [Acidobacteriota bacterium]
MVRASSSETVSPTRTPETAIVFPASFAQERLWFLQELDPESALYNIFGTVLLRGDLNVKAITASVQAIVSRHEVLRTTFELSDGRPVQVVHDELSVSVPLIDLTNLPESQRQAEAGRRALEESARPFHLESGPLFRLQLLRLAEREHALLLTFHHIVFDAWSMGVFFRELSALYASLRFGETPSLPPLAIQYGDFGEWQREWLTGEVLEEQLAFWKGQLAGAPGFLELPTDRPRPSLQTSRGDRHSIVLSPSLSSELKALSRSQGATLFMTMLAAFQAFLGRLTQQEDLVVGSPIAGRNRQETEELIGFFVNTLVLRADLSGDPTFRELLQRVREVSLAAYAHQDLPFERLVEELKPERSLGHSPIFQVMFAMQNASREKREIPGLELAGFPVSRPVSHFDLSLDVTERDDELVCSFSYNTDLFEGATVARLAALFRSLLEGVAADAEERVWRVRLLSDVERRQITEDWNRTDTLFPRHKVLHQILEDQAARTPDAVAVIAGRERISYRDLDERANRLARYLRRAGVGRDSHVGLCMERSIEVVVAMLGILKAGGAYVPLDPSYPADRLAFMIEDCGAATILTDERLSGSLPQGPARLIRVDGDAKAISREDGAPLEPLSTPESLAYVIYTSGSTGIPKGVQIQHRSIVNYAIFAGEKFELGPGDRMLQFASISFDTAAEEIYSTLTRGAALVLRSDLMLESPAVFLKECGALGITVLDLPTAYWHELAAGLGEGGAAVPESLRLVVIGGEKALADRARQWFRSAPPGTRVLNGYGPTETTIAVTFVEVDAASVTDGREISIGRPISNVQAYVLDRFLEPVAIGIPGELHIGGESVARGYLNRPALMTEKFVPDPFRNGSLRLYKTGDRVRYLPDGAIEYLGRMDEQIKVRGYRVELGEIESALRRATGVADAVVVARGEGAQKRLVAYIVPQQKPGPSTADLRQRLGRSLPDYMIPSAFVLVDSFPMTPTGKLDRRALPEPGSEHSESGKTFTPPRNEIEARLVGIWEEVLNVRPVGITDNFFDLGGFSLLAVRLFAILKREFGRELPLATVFRASTVEQLAALLSQETSSPAWNSLVPIQPRGSKPPLYLIHAGGGHVIFYMDLTRHLGPDQPVYGLQARGLDGKQPRGESVESMAADYLREIQEFQSRGPYSLGGASYGGVIAFEMAQQLLRQSEAVRILAVFDTWGPDYPNQRPRRSMKFQAVEFIERVDLHLGNFLVAKGPREKLIYLKTKSGILAGNVLRVNRRRWAKMRKLIGLPKSLRQVEDAIGNAKRRYFPQFYPGKLTLFRATKQPAGYGYDRELGWTRVVGGGVEVHEVPGYHGAIVHEPRVGIMADQLTRCLDECLAKESAGEPDTESRKSIDAALEPGGTL